MKKQESCLEGLIGHQIEKAFIAPDRKTLIFVLDQHRYFIVRTEADCCNDVWFEHISGLNTLFNSPVLEVTVKDWSEKKPTRDGECEEAGFWTIKTQRGHCTLEVRNSHNGYYGGDIVCSDLINNKELTEDF